MWMECPEELLKYFIFCPIRANRPIDQSRVPRRMILEIRS